MVGQRPQPMAMNGWSWPSRSACYSCGTPRIGRSGFAPLRQVPDCFRARFHFRMTSSADPGTVYTENPEGGAAVVQGTAAQTTISTCTGSGHLE